MKQLSPLLISIALGSLLLVVLAGCAASSTRLTRATVIAQEEGTAATPTTENDTTTNTSAEGDSEGTTADAAVGRGLSALADTEIGRAYFHGEAEPDAEGFVACKTCHYTDPEEDVLVGPNLAGVADRADSQVPGQSAEAYLRTSIVDHNAHIVEGFEEDVVLMVVGEDFGDILEPQDVDHLVAYLLTLKEGATTATDTEGEKITPTPVAATIAAAELAVNDEGYIDAADGFTFQPIEGWQNRSFTTNDADASTLLTQPQDATLAGGPFIALRAGTLEDLNIPNESPAATENAQELFDLFIAESFEQETSAVSLTYSETVRIADAPALLVAFGGSGFGDVEGEVQGRLAMVQIDEENVFVMLGLAAPAAAWTIDDEFDTILDSITFEERSAHRPAPHSPTPAHTAAAIPPGHPPLPAMPAMRDEQLFAMHHPGSATSPGATLLHAPAAAKDTDRGSRFACINCHITHDVEMLHDSNPSCKTCHSGTPFQRHCVDCHSIHGVDMTHEPNNPGCETCHAQEIPGEGINAEQTLITFMAYLFHDV